MWTARILQAQRSRKATSLLSSAPKLFSGCRLFASQGAGSLFEFDDSAAQLPTNRPESEEFDSSAFQTNRELRNHPDVKAKLDPPGETAVQSLLSPLKRSLYEKVLAANAGRYVNKQIVEYEGERYQLNLSRAEQRALEPSVYVSSYRIKSSWKKAYVFLRMFRRMGLGDAISQCRFSAKRMGRDMAEMFERAFHDAKKLGLEPSDLVIEQIWVGKDGFERKRPDFKGRGRSGIINHPYVHIKAILKPRWFAIDQKKVWFKQKRDRHLWFQLPNAKIKDDSVQTADYKW